MRTARALLGPVGTSLRIEAENRVRAEERVDARRGVGVVTVRDVEVTGGSGRVRGQSADVARAVGDGRLLSACEPCALAVRVRHRPFVNFVPSWWKIADFVQDTLLLLQESPIAWAGMR